MMTATLHEHVRWATARHSVPRSRATSNAQQLLQIIQRERRVRTADLCDLAGGTSSTVWGALAYHIRAGRIRFDDGVWSWAAGITQDEKRAADFLRARGWTLQEPIEYEDDDDGHYG